MTLVHAFLHTHVPKLAAKLAAKFPNLSLEEQTRNAEARSNALVSTVHSALQVKGSDIYNSFSEDMHVEEDRVKERKVPKASHGQESASKKKKSKSKEKQPKNQIAKEEEEKKPMGNPPVQEPEASDAERTQDVNMDEIPSPPKKSKGPKQGERFQRVRSDKVEFQDDRLRDMSYDAKSGAGDWGARANADLIVTRGKSFTKEKNKKKRGSYRGGVIDQGSHSIKFTYDDE